MEQKKQCKRCGYFWVPRSKKVPKACPFCKSYRWNQVSNQVGNQKESK